MTEDRGRQRREVTEKGAAKGGRLTTEVADNGGSRQRREVDQGMR